MQPTIQPGQFRQATLLSSQSSSIPPEILSSALTGQSIKADVLSATLEQITQQQQSIAQYKAQIIVQGKVLEITTQFPLDQGDKLELKVTSNNQLTIEKVIPSSNSSKDQGLNKETNNLTNPAKTQASSQDTQIKQITTNQKPITNEQINHVIRMWLSQSRPAIGALLDLSLTMEAANKIIETLPYAQLQGVSTGKNSPANNQAQLSNMLLLISSSIQSEVFKLIPNSNHLQFKQEIHSLIQELVNWQTPSSATKGVTPTSVTGSPFGNTETQSKSTLINALLKLQLSIQDSLSQATTSNKETTSTSGLAPVTQTTAPINTSSQTGTNSHIPILQEWTQILSLMTPATTSQNDMLDWMLESIRRISGTGQKIDTTNGAILEKLAAETAGLTGKSPANIQNAQQTIETSQWLRLAEFRKHQLFTGNIKHSLLQSTSDLQISNTLRQLLVSVEELTGRMSALRLASASSQLDSSSNNMIHVDLPVMTSTGPTSVELDMEHVSKDKDEEDSSKRETKNQWLVHLKFELPPLAPFIGQIIYNPDQQTLSANFFTDHKQTLALLNQHIGTLETQLNKQSQSSVTISSRFGLIDMPREALIKKTHHKVNVNV